METCGLAISVACLHLLVQAELAEPPVALAALRPCGEILAEPVDEVHHTRVSPPFPASDLLREGPQIQRITLIAELISTM